jgi:hypothetical protein
VPRAASIRRSCPKLTVADREEPRSLDCTPRPASPGCCGATEARGMRPVTFLGPVYGSFTEGFDATDLKEAKELLDELA